VTAATTPAAIVTGRSGLSGTPSKVAYLGTSVTRQRNGYRPRLHELLERRRGRPLETVAAGLGAMDAVAFAFLTDEFITSHGPDLCFVDVTSSMLSPNRTSADGEAALDGIFTKLRRAACETCLLHLPWRVRGRRFASRMAAFEAVAELHGVPSIDLATPLHEAAAAGLLDDGRLFRDEVHTSEEGSAAYAAALDAAVGDLMDAGREEVPPLPDAPATSFRDSRHVPADPADGGEPGRFRLLQPFVRVAEGSVTRRTFEGSVDGITLVLGPESGEIEVTDPRGSQRAMPWDPWSHYERFGAVLFPRSLEPGEVTIAPTGRRPDYSQSPVPIDPPDRTTLKLIGYLERL
jgi:hypothetical protein